VRVVALVGDLLLASRIEEPARTAGADYARIDDVADLPDDDVDLLLVDWSSRRPDWADALAAWSDRPGAGRLILFGQHTDLEAHAAARGAGLGPMWARSKLVAQMPKLVARCRTAPH
jgi:hypothetical protein